MLCSASLPGRRLCRTLSCNAHRQARSRPAARTLCAVRAAFRPAATWLLLTMPRTASLLLNRAAKQPVGMLVDRVGKPAQPFAAEESQPAIRLQSSTCHARFAEHGALPELEARYVSGWWSSYSLYLWQSPCSLITGSERMGDMRFRRICVLAFARGAGIGGPGRAPIRSSAQEIAARSWRLPAHGCKALQVQGVGGICNC